MVEFVSNTIPPDWSTMPKHIYLYGNQKLRREWCPRCGQVAIVVCGSFQCCDLKIESDSEEGVAVKRVTMPVQQGL